MQRHPFIFYVLVVLLCIIIIDYWVIVYCDPWEAIRTDDKTSLVLLKLSGKSGIIFRGSFMLLWLVFLLNEQNTSISIGRETPRDNFILVLMIITFLNFSMVMIFIDRFPLRLILYLFPFAIVAIFFLGASIVLMIDCSKNRIFGIKNEKRKVKTPYGFNFKTNDGYVNVPNPFRGLFISGSAGAGKSMSLAYPIIQQAVRKEYTGIVYDYKFPVLAEQVHAAIKAYDRKEISFYLLNFHDLSRSHRVNPINAALMPVVAYADEYSMAILHNLMPETIKKKDFWIRSANAILTAVIWFLKKHHPQYCTIPHAINIVLYKDYKKTMRLLASDPETAGMVRSAITAIENEAEGQIAGVIGSLQISIARINSPEICWVLSGDDFNLQLNDPSHPKMLVVGTDPALADAFSPVISCIITVALKLMNRPGKLPGLVLLDEGPTLYIPKLEMVPATGRSNKIATVYMAQDVSQLVDNYGREKAEVIIANLNNQFYGRVSSAQSAKMISELFGREEKEMESRSAGQSHLGLRLNSSQSISRSFQEKQVVRPQDLVNLRVGEFIGTTVESKSSFFWSHIRAKEEIEQGEKINSFAFNVDVHGNFEKVRREAEIVITSS